MVERGDDWPEALAWTGLEYSFSLSFGVAGGEKVEDEGEEEVVIGKVWTTMRSGSEWPRVLLDMELVGLLDTKALTLAWLEIVFLIPRNLFGMSRT